MTKDNIKRIYNWSKRYNKTVNMYNEDGRCISSLSESTKTIFDDAKEILVSVRTNTDYSSADPFVVQCIEYDSIKMTKFSATYKEVMELVKELGQNESEFREFLNSTSAVGRSDPANYSQKYTTDEDGKLVKSEEPVSNIPFISLG